MTYEDCLLASYKSRHRPTGNVDVFRSIPDGGALYLIGSLYR